MGIHATMGTQHGRILVLVAIMSTGLLHAQDPFSRVTITWPKPGASNTIAWIDYDMDGDLDFFITNGAESVPMENFLYRNDGGGVFTQITTGDIVTESMISAGAAWGDYDGDDDPDVYVTTATYDALPLFGGTRNNDLFENNGDGTFTMITTGDAVNEDEHSASCAWIDYDGDGDLDLFVTNGTPRLGASTPLPRAPFLFENDGTGTLTQLANTAAGDLLQDSTFSAAHSWGDFDNDGDLDVFVCSGGRNNSSHLYRNNGNGTFTRILTATFNDTVITHGATWADYDNDGDLDLFLTNAKGDSIGENNYLYQNNGDGTFTRITTGVIVNDGGPSYGATWGDYDNDGDLDLFVANAKDAGWVVYNFLYRNDGPPNYTFTKITNTIVATDTNNSRGCAFADYDHDGFLDLMVVHNDRFNENNLYHNELKTQGNTNHYGVFIAQGTSSNRQGIGTRIRVKANPGSGSIWQLREITPTYGLGSVNLRAHFGLGSATRIDSLTVYWPYTGITSVFTDIEVDQIMTVVEGGNSTTAAVRSSQTGEFLMGSTGATLDFTGNTDPDGGSVTVVRYNTGPTNNAFSGSATAPDGSTVTPNVVAPDRYWVVSTPDLTNITYTISLDINNLPGVSNPDRLVIVKRPDNTSPWVPLNTTRIGNRLFAAGLTAFSEFTIASNTGDNALPVTLSVFEALPGHGKVLLRWVTESEVNNLGFILQRAAGESGPFVDIATYQSDKTLRGSGNSATRREYTFEDQTVTNGTTYFYRLFDVDFNGNRTFLSMVSATPKEIPMEFVLHPNFPNPFNPSTTLRFSIPEQLKGAGEKITLVIYNAKGQEVRRLWEAPYQPGTYRVRWDGRDDSGRIVASGLYIAVLRVGYDSRSQKMLFIR